MACLHELLQGFNQLSGGLLLPERIPRFHSCCESDAFGGAETEVGIILCLQQAVRRGNGHE